MTLADQDQLRAGSGPGAEPSVPRLEVREVGKRYGTVVAAERVSFRCAAGEVHALVGENGAGKSTVAKIVAGLVRADSGTVLVDGEPLPGGSISAAHRRGVYCAFQELALVPQWTVAECLALVDSHAARAFRPRAARRAAAAQLERLGLAEIDPGAPIESLSLAARQQVEIARALLARPRILLLDEASSALTPPGVAWLFERIRELKREGTAVIYVSHRLGEIRDIADRGTVLRDGRDVDSFVRGGYDEEGLITAMAGQPTGELFPERPPLDPGAPVALAVEGLEAARIEEISLTVRSGEILGIGGLQGHGQAELLRCLYGAQPARWRSWRVGDRSQRRLSPRRAVRAGLGFVPEDRKHEGLALEVSVGENLLAPWLSPFGIGGAPLVRRRRPWIDRVLAALSIKTRGPQETVGNLSGGNQQKVVFGRWLERGRRVLLLHDPTRGIDVGSKHELYEAVAEQARQGTAVIWLSTEVEELVHLCHRVLVLYSGTIHSELTADQLSPERVVGAVVGKEAA